MAALLQGINMRRYDREYGVLDALAHRNNKEWQELLDKIGLGTPEIVEIETEVDWDKKVVILHIETPNYPLVHEMSFADAEL